MKIVILAGGLGSRISEETQLKPKPMISIGDKPILWHIMQIYAHYKHNDFYIALGYKGEVIKKYFKENINTKWKVNLVDTGQDTMTGGRLKRLQKFIGNETFMLTYGDGLSNININSLISFHKKHKKMATISAVRPPARWGALKLDQDRVVSFEEKSQLKESWINGGFFVLEPEFVNLIEGDQTVLEKEPLEKVAEMNELRAFKHQGFWQPMDTIREKKILEKLWFSGEAPWKF